MLILIRHRTAPAPGEMGYRYIHPLPPHVPPLSICNHVGIKIKNTTTGIDLTPPHKTGFLGRGEIDSQSGILNFYSGRIPLWHLIERKESKEVIEGK